MKVSRIDLNKKKLQDLLVPGITIKAVFRNVLRQRDEETALAAIAHKHIVQR